MTINEKKQLSEYIKGLVRESISEMPLPNGFNYMDELPDEFDDKLDDMSKPTEEGEFPWPEDLKPSDGVSNYPNDEEEPASLEELRQLAESYARDAVRGFLMEKKGKNQRKSDGKKKGSKKPSGTEKSIMDRLNSDSVNAAHYFYKLYNARTKAQKDAARSLGYKKAQGKPMPGKKGTYHFNSKERTKLRAMLTTDKN